MKNILFAAVSFFSFSCFSQGIDRVRLDSLFDRLAGTNLAIGSIAIARDGKIVYSRTFGSSTGSARLGPTTGSGSSAGLGPVSSPAYRIGSITKVFTGIMVYELIDKKKLSLDDTLSKFFPGLPNAGRITIAELLGHRSGLPNFTATATGFDNWKEQPHTHDQLLAFIRMQSPDFSPGAKADYKNSNFLLLGYILEKVYHQSYKDLVTERIIRRLGLRHTYYGDHAGFQNNEAPSFKYFDNQWKKENAVYLDNFGGAGAMISTPGDLCQFITAIFDGKLISKASLARMTHIEKDGYGWGMFSFGDSVHTGYGHSGKTEGFASSMQYFPSTHMAIGYCTNGEVYPKDEILNAVFKICFDEPVALPAFTAVTVPPDRWQLLTGTYTGDNGLVVNVSIANGGLVLETKGQKFPVDALSDREFFNRRFGFFFDFDGAGQLVVHDAAVTYWLHKK